MGQHISQFAKTTDESWIRILSRRDWGLLSLALLFWLLDGYATYVLIVTVAPALHSILKPNQLPLLPRYAAYLVALTLVGWATGGIIGGRIGDRLGRRKTMIGAVVIYGVFTGLSAFSTSWQMLGLMRILTGIGIGAEWGVGTSLFQESWPNQARTKGAGLLQAGFSLGALFASGLWVVLGSHYGLSWRWMYGIGVLPVILVVILSPKIPESRQWIARTGSAQGLFSGVYRRRIILTILVSISITVGWWAISSWIPTFTALMASSARAKAYYAGMAGVLYNIGEIFGCIAFGFLAESWGRRGTALLYFIGSLLITPVVFLFVHNVTLVVLLQLINGYLTGGLYSWYTIHPPELFPTAMRASAISLIFNSARYLAMVGAVVSSLLIEFFGGYGIAATVFGLIYILGMVSVALLPETKGQPLPQ